MNFPVIDLHCDTVLALLGNDMNQAGSLRKNRFHSDLERASLQMCIRDSCCSCSRPT